MKLRSYTATGKPKTLEIKSKLFDGVVNQQLLSQALRVYQSNQRQGTSKVKTRAEVKLTKRKIYRQKGTGNARHGAKSAPIFVGGGVAHGPDGTQQWNKKLSKKMKQQALIAAFRAQAEHVVVDQQHTAVTGKTKDGVAFLKSIDALGKKVLIILPTLSQEVERSFNNISSVALQTANSVNLLDVSRADVLCLSKDVIDALHQRFGLDVETKKKVDKEKVDTTK